jgi:hypothetical protein
LGKHLTVPAPRSAMGRKEEVGIVSVVTYLHQCDPHRPSRCALLVHKLPTQFGPLSSQFGVGGPSASSSGPVRVSRRKVVRQSTFTPPAACFDFGIVWLCWVCFENAIRGREFCRKGLCAASVSMPAYPKKEGVHVDCPRRISTPADPMFWVTRRVSRTGNPSHDQFSECCNKLAGLHLELLGQS